MKFTCTIACDNAAFDDEPATELARILKLIARRIEDGYEHGACVDSNGNTVGSWKIK